MRESAPRSHPTTGLGTRPDPRCTGWSCDVAVAVLSPRRGEYPDCLRIADSRINRGVGCSRSRTSPSPGWQACCVQQSPVTIVLRLEVTGCSPTRCCTSWGSLPGSEGTLPTRGDICSTARIPPVTGRALDVGCGSGRDAVYLAKPRLAGDRGRLGRQGARYRSAAGSRRGRRGAVGQGPCGGAGLARPRTGYNLVYDFGCIHGLSDAARTGAAAGLTHLAAPGATLLMVAFKAGRGIVLPRDGQAGRRRAATRWLGPRGKPVGRDR